MTRFVGCGARRCWLALRGNGAAGIAICHAERALSMTGLARAREGEEHAQLAGLCLWWVPRSPRGSRDVAAQPGSRARGDGTRASRSPAGVHRAGKRSCRPARPAWALAASSLAKNDISQEMPLQWFHCTVALAQLHAGDWDAAERHLEPSCATVEELAFGGPPAMVCEERALVAAHREGTPDFASAHCPAALDQFQKHGALCSPSKSGKS